MNKPSYQKFIMYLTWLLSGFLALGTFLDAVGNAISLISLPISVSGTFLLFIIWFSANWYLKKRPTAWHLEDGSVIRINRLNKGISLPLFGMIILLWIPITLDYIGQVQRHYDQANFENKISSAIETQLGRDVFIVEIETIDLDGSGSSEAAVSWRDNEQDIFKNRFGVWKLDENDEWKSLLIINELSDLCAPSNTNYEGSIDLFGDGSRQIVVSTGCGTGIRLFYFEIYRLNELGLMERIFPSPQDNNHNSVSFSTVPQMVRIVNETLYVHTLDDNIYSCYWDNSALGCVEVEIDPGPGLITIEYWYDEDEKIHVSQEKVTLRVGEYLEIKARSEGDVYKASRILHSANGPLEWRANYYLAVKPGTDSIIIGYVFDMASIEVEVNEN